MNGRLLALLLLSVPFLAVTGVALFEHGFIAIFAVATRDSASAQVFFDLCIALFIATGWLRQDAKRRGLAWLPWVLATPALGSIAPLGYLAYRELKRPAVAAQTAI